MQNHRYVLGLVGLVLGLVAASAPVSATYINGTTVPPATGPTPDEACLPMGGQLWQRWSYCDVAAGLFSFSQVDMTVAGPMPIVLRRVYRSEAVDTSGNAVLEPFGNGMNFDYNIFLWSPSEAASGTLTNVDVILANGAQVDCACQGNGNCTPGSGLQFQCKATPSQTFYGATIQYDSSPQSWVLTTKEQTKYSFSYGQSQGSILQSITDRYGNSVTINRQQPNAWFISSSNGRSVVLTLATINGEQVITQAQGNGTTSYGYTTYGSGSNQTSMTSSTDANGKTTNYTWYTPEDMGSIKPSQNNGLLVEPTDIGYTALGSGYQFTYLTPPQSQGYYQITYTNSGGHVTDANISDPMTYVRSLVFNSGGYVTSETLNSNDGGGTPSETATYTRDPASNFVTDKVDALGRHTHYGYDFSTTDVGDLLNVTLLYGTSTPIETSYIYTSTFHQAEKITDPLGHITYFYPCSPDTNGFICEFEDAVDNTITFTPEPTGQVMTATDQAGDKTTFGYDPAGTGDLTSVTDPNGNTTSATYDGAGRLKSVTDPLRNTTTYQLDGVGNVTQITDPASGVTTFGYDDVGNPLTVTDANNHPAATNTYDLRNRLTKFCDARNNCTNYGTDGTGGYDADDNLIQSNNAAGITTEYSYDTLNRRIETQYDVGGSSATNVQVTYDLGNRIIEAVDSANGTITHQFGQAGSPTGSNTTLASGLDFITEEATPGSTVSYVPDLAGRRTSMTLTKGGVSGTPVQYQYDFANKLTIVSQSPWNVTKNFNYSAGRLGSIALPNGVVVSSTYDNDSNVKSLTYKTSGGTTLGTLSYNYDPDGRRTGVSGTLATTGIPNALGPLVYNNDNSLASIGGTSVSNDAMGDITGMNGPCSTCYGAFTYDPRGNLQQAYTLVSGEWVTQDYSYDAFGRRYGTTVTTGSGTTPVSYALDGWNVLLGYNGSSSISSLLGIGLDECYLEDFDGTSTSSVLKDALGSVVGLTNSSQAITDTYRYDPYGTTTHPTGTSINGLLFAGQPYENNNLYFMRHRYYLPAIGRFISRDPIGLNGGINMYAYAADDPTNDIDPLGLWAIGAIGGLSGETGLGVMSEGGSVSAGFGYFTGGGFGGFNTSGSFALAPGVPGSAAQMVNPPSPGSNAAAFGLSAGLGWGIFWSPDAQTRADLSGPFRTYSLTIGGLTFQYSGGYAADGRWIREFAFIPFGPARGFSASVSNTLTTPWATTPYGDTVPFNLGITPGPGNIGAGSRRGRYNRRKPTFGLHRGI